LHHGNGGGEKLPALKQETSSSGISMQVSSYSEKKIKKKRKKSIRQYL